MIKKISLLFLLVFILGLASCTQKGKYVATFDNTHDRIWVGKDFWSIPLEDWKVENGRLHCTGTVPNSRVNLLTHVLSPEAGNFEFSASVDLAEKGDVPGSAGFLIGVHDEEDPDIRAACYHGEGIKAGVSMNGFAFLNEERVKLSEGFDFSTFRILVQGNNNRLTMEVKDEDGAEIAELTCPVEGVRGLVAVANNLRLGEGEKPGDARFIFDDLSFSGSKVIHKPELPVWRPRFRRMA